MISRTYGGRLKVYAYKYVGSDFKSSNVDIDFIRWINPIITF